MAEVMPYETLVRWGIVDERLHEVADQLAQLAERAGQLIDQLSGRFDARGFRVAPSSPLGDALADEFWKQYFRDVERARRGDG